MMTSKKRYPPPPVHGNCVISGDHIFIDAAEHDRLIIGRAGSEFPLETPLLEWPAHHVATFNPFTGCNGLDKVRVQ